MNSKVTRRELFRWSAFGAGALGLSACRQSAVSISPGPQPPDFSIGFLTDSHIDGKRGSADGFRKALDHAVGGERPPELFIMGGDQPMDIMRTGIEEADFQYDLWDAEVAGVSQDIHVVLGNHDILGIADESPLDASHPQYGKQYFLDRFGLEKSYHSFDHEGWHFVILDSVAIDGNSYKGWVDEEQLAWLDDDLAASGKPTVIATHVPIFSNFMEMLRGTSEGIPSGISVVNSHEVAKIIEGHRVRLVLAGHLHINESFHYKGTEYANIGAISGNWWKGPRNGFEEGYARLDFRGDQLDWNYVDYGWEPPVEVEEEEAV